MAEAPAAGAGRPGLVLAAPASGSGKTALTLSLLRALAGQGRKVAAAKVGPDFIDPAFHAAAGAHACFNLDTWAMRTRTLRWLAGGHGGDAELVVCEGVMGLFDGAPGGGGSTASVSRLTGWPVVLVVDASAMADSAAALVSGFARHDPQVSVGGVIFNRVGGEGHCRLLRRACEPLGIPVLGCVPADEALHLGERHLGLVQAAEHAGLEELLAHGAGLMERHCDLAALTAMAAPCRLPPAPPVVSVPYPGRVLAVASDTAFAFLYPHVLAGWRAAGVEVRPFSPLADEPPDPGADAVYLPGGYPELHAARLAQAGTFRRGMLAAAKREIPVYGECGGYMVLGETLTDAAGDTHAMLGLLPVRTSFRPPSMTIGYRRARLAVDGFIGARGSRWRGHEFHFARQTAGEDSGAGLYEARSADEEAPRMIGHVRGSVAGSFLHVVDAGDGQESVG